MPFRSFADFSNIQPAFTDFLVGYNPLRGEYKTRIITLNNLITGGGYDIFNYVFSNSAKWDGSYTTVNSLSNSWTSSYTTVNSNSALWLTVATGDARYLGLTGGEITGNLVINGSLTALGDSFFVNTISPPLVHSVS